MPPLNGAAGSTAAENDSDHEPLAPASESSGGDEFDAAAVARAAKFVRAQTIERVRGACGSHACLPRRCAASLKLGVCGARSVPDGALLCASPTPLRPRQPSADVVVRGYAVCLLLLYFAVTSVLTVFFGRDSVFGRYSLQGLLWRVVQYLDGPKHGGVPIVPGGDVYTYDDDA